MITPEDNGETVYINFRKNQKHDNFTTHKKNIKLM